MWVDDYIAMASQHCDADGRHPVHSYFLMTTPTLQRAIVQSALTKFNQATYGGYGEVEYHCHHGATDERKRTEDVATTTLISQITLAKEYFNKHGALITAERTPKCTFGFIHGMWCLDNTRYDDWTDPHDPHYEYCGVNQELRILSQLGCYADFTFPAWGPMEPLLHDAIFYAADDNDPGSYKKSANIRVVEVNQPPFGDLMIIQGPKTSTNVGVVPGSYYQYATLARMDDWVAHNVHITGRNDWIFIKVYTHGCMGNVSDPATWDSFFGKTMDKFYTDIEQKYNDGVNWKLHYVSAREMYNIIKAAEAGLTGDPGAYRDFLIPPYANMVILTENEYRLIKYGAEEIRLEMLDNPTNVEFSLKGFRFNSLVFESDESDGSWQLSDGTRDAGQFGELNFRDQTVSRYYRVIPRSIPLEKPPGSPPADIDDDCSVDFIDFSIFALSWLSEEGDPAWNPKCDISNPADGVIDASDLAVFAEWWLRGCP
jgi:hypothetical protein